MDPTAGDLLQIPEWATVRYKVDFLALGSINDDLSDIVVVVTDPGWARTKPLPPFVRMSSELWSQSCGPVILSNGDVVLGHGVAASHN